MHLQVTNTRPGTVRPTVVSDMTVGSVPRHLIKFAVPLLLGNLLQALYNTVDAIWVGRYLGPNSLAAVSVSFPVIMVLVSMIMGVSMATTVLVAQNTGAKRPDEVRRITGNSMSVLILLGATASIIGLLFHRHILHLINVPGEILTEASLYLSVFLSGLVFMFIYNVLSGILRGLGNSRAPVVFLAYATTLNIILDPLLIFGIGPLPRMGVSGAALATVISQVFAGLLTARYILKNTDLLSKRLSDYRIDKDLTITTFKIGLPVGVQHTMMSLGALVVSSIINSFGETVVAGFGAGSRLDHFAIMPFMSLGMSVSSLVGQNLGARKHERVHETVKWAFVISGAIAACMTLLFLLVPGPVLSIFTVDQQVLAVGVSYLRVLALSYIPWALTFAMTGVMRGAGDTVPAMLISVATLWFVRVPLARYLSTVPSLQQNGIWWAMVASASTSMLLSSAYYLGGRWKKRSVLSAAPAVAAE